MVDIQNSIIGERLRKALQEGALREDERYARIIKSTCEQLYEAYKTTPIVRSRINIPGQSPKIGREDITGVKDETDESDRDEPVIEWYVNSAPLDEILNEAILLGCDWAQKIVGEIISKKGFKHTQTPVT